MTEIWKDKLRSKYAFLDCPIECGNGHREIIENMCADLQRYMINFFLYEDPKKGFLDEKTEDRMINLNSFRIYDICDKWAHLRISSRNGDTYTEMVTNDAENDSAKVCGRCGRDELSGRLVNRAFECRSCDEIAKLKTRSSSPVKA